MITRIQIIPSPKVYNFNSAALASALMKGGSPQRENFHKRNPLCPPDLR